jgi:serine/threonine protein kinase
MVKTEAASDWDDGPEVQKSGGNLRMKDIHDFSMDVRSSVCLKARKPTTVGLSDFELKTQLGRGTFGKVFLAQLKQTGKLFAIKVIRKDVLLEKEQVESTILEKDILFAADHPFLVGMDFLFQTETRLYFVMPFVQGGELYKIFISQKRFPEKVVKFYAA